MKTTEEKNAMIAEFMGFEKLPKNHWEVKMHFSTFIIPPFAMRFNESWDWLMPVVDKIYQLETGRMDGILSALMRAYIDQVYSEVCQFIERYNSRKV